MLLQAKPSRLHCSHCDETYTLPQNGTIKLYKELRCPLDDFELVLWSSGSRGKSYPLCPYCANHPPFRDMKKGECPIPGPQPLPPKTGCPVPCGCLWRVSWPCPTPCWTHRLRGRRLGVYVGTPDAEPAVCHSVPVIIDWATVVRSLRIWAVPAPGLGEKMQQVGGPHLARGAPAVSVFHHSLSSWSLLGKGDSCAGGADSPEPGV